MNRRPHSPAEWVVAIREGRKRMADVPEILQMPVQYQGMKWAERAFEIEARRKRG